MGFETKTTGWTVETLKEHVEKIFSDNEKRYGERYESQNEAIKKAETAAEKRFDSVNEFRAQLKDQTQTFIPRAECEQRFAAMNEKIDLLIGTNRELQGQRKGFHEGWGIFIAGLGILIAFVTIMMKK